MHVLVQSGEAWAGHILGMSHMPAGSAEQGNVGGHASRSRGASVDLLPGSSNKRYEGGPGENRGSTLCL